MRNAIISTPNAIKVTKRIPAGYIHLGEVVRESENAVMFDCVFEKRRINVWVPKRILLQEFMTPYYYAPYPFVAKTQNIPPRHPSILLDN